MNASAHWGPTCCTVARIRVIASPRDNIAVLVTAALSSFLVAGLDPLDSVRLLALFGLIVLLGSPWWLLANKGRTTCLGETLGAGAAIGLATLGLIQVAFRGNAALGALAVAVAVSLSTIILRLRDGRRSLSLLGDRDMFFLGLAPIVALAPFNPKALPATILIGALAASSGAREWLARQRPTVLAGLALIPGVATRTCFEIFDMSSPWRDTIEADIVLDESAATGLSQFGPSVSMQVFGEHIVGNFLGHAAFGLGNSVVGLPGFASVSAGGFTAILIAVALLAYSSIRQFTSSDHAGWLALTTLFAQSSLIPTTLVVPALRAVNAAALLWLMLAILCFIRAQRTPKAVNALWFHLATAMAIMGKLHYSAVLLLFVWMHALPPFGSKREPIRVVGLALPSTLLAGIWYLTMTVRGDGDPNGLSPQLGYVIAIIPLALIRFMLIDVIRASRRSRELRSLAIVTVVSCVVFAITGTFLVMHYLFFAVIAICSVLIPCAIDWRDTPTSLRRSGNYLNLAAFASGFALAVARLIVEGASIFETDLSWWPNPSMSPVLLLAALIYLGLRVLTSRPAEGGAGRPFARVPLALAVALSTGMYAGHTSKHFVYHLTFGEVGYQTEVLTDDQRAVGAWFQQNSQSGDLLASNSLCPVRVEIGSVITGDDPGGRCEGRNHLAWLSALSHRRVLMESPVFSPLAWSRLRNPDHVAYYNDSVAYGANRDPSALRNLRRLGVRWFVVDLPLSAVRDWESETNVALVTDSYLVIDLR